MGGGHDKPSALQFKYRLRWCVLGKHSSDMLAESKNTEDDEDETLIDSVDFHTLHTEDTDAAMDEIMGSLYIEEDYDFNEDSYDSSDGNKDDDDYDENFQETGIFSLKKSISK